MDLPNDRYDRGSRGLTVVFVVSDEQADLLRERIYVEQKVDPFPGGEFPLAVDLFDLVRAASDL